MIPLDFSKKAKISMCPKLNSSLASRTTFFFNEAYVKWPHSRNLSYGNL